jgi:hypothetical protein
LSNRNTKLEVKKIMDKQATLAPDKKLSPNPIPGRKGKSNITTGISPLWLGIIN